MSLAIIVLMVLVAYGLYNMLGGKASRSKHPPKISLIPATPPPPPPPPKEEKRPEPPKVEKEVKMMQEEKREQPPADASLKMEGAAGDGPSLFGAGKVTNEDLSHIGSGNGSGGNLINPFNTYAMTVKGELQRKLARNSDLKRRHYKVELLLWITLDGHLKRFELLNSSNDDETDGAIRDALAAFPAFSEPPPEKMPQPIKLRIVASGRA